jgi:hypothetical protein
MANNTFHIYDSTNNETDEYDRYTIGLDIARHEYQLRIDRIKGIDDKIEKLLIINAALLAALITIMTSEKIIAILQEIIARAFLSNELGYAIFISSFMLCLLLLIYSLSLLLRGLFFVSTIRMPNTIELMDYQNDNPIKWIRGVIKSYDGTYEMFKEAINIKSSFVKIAQFINLLIIITFAILLPSSMILLFFN